MDEPKSKSQKKREADALQKIGVELIGLSLEKLDKLPLPEHLRRAILEAKLLRSHGAIRRQAQLIGKLMRQLDSDEVLLGYEQLLSEASSQTAEFHHIEQWRTRLITEGNTALTEFIANHSPQDVQQLRHMIKKAVDEQKNELHTGASKALFRYIRSCLQ